MRNKLKKKDEKLQRILKSEFLKIKIQTLKLKFNKLKF